MKLRTGDSVVIISGKDKGKQGTILRVLPKLNRIVVEGVNMRIRHIRRTPNQAGQRITYEASIHVSNAMILDPKTKKPTRVGYKVDEKTGKKSRFAKKSGETIAKAAATKAKAPAKKEAAAKKGEEKVDPTKPIKTDAPKAPAKTPFWKRGFRGEGSEAEGGESGTAEAKAMPAAHRSQGG